MKHNTVIIDYGMGNLASVRNALNHLQVQNQISDNISEIQKADFLILPGVGSFRQGMNNLNNLGLIDVLNHEVLIKKKPILGICLGMQLFAESGTEPTECAGLSWISGHVIKMEEPNLRIPHLGWNNVTFLLEHFKEYDQQDFYFIHSYHFEVTNPDHILATVNYGKDYVAAILRDNIMATQFHPEKSQKAGLKLLHNFYKFYAENKDYSYTYL
jgi:glutamine amidotransferase